MLHWTALHSTLHAPCVHADSCLHLFNIRRNLWLLNASFVSPRSLDRVSAAPNHQQDCLLLASSRVAAMWMCLNMARLHGRLLSSPTCNYAIRMASMCGHYILAQLCCFCLCLHEKNDQSLDPCLVLCDNMKDWARKEEEIWRFYNKIRV